MQETQVWSMGGKEKEMTTHSSILGWEIPRSEDPGVLQSMVSQVSDMTATKPTRENWKTT